MNSIKEIAQRAANHNAVLSNVKQRKLGGSRGV